MNKKLREYWENNTLLVIMICAAILRLIAAIFAKGYAMNDDHFVIIHVAQRWLDGYDDWFNKDHPSGFSLVYTGLHYILFYLLKSIGITDPVVKMYIVRFIHAVYSLLTVYFGYKITLLLSNKKMAAQVGIMLATFWLMPFMSVRNLIEMVCIPPMMAGFYYVLKGEQSDNRKYWILAGLLFGLAFSIRYQTILIPGGVGLILLFRKDWQRFGYFTIGTIAGLFVVQGVVDWIFWGFPFAAFMQYAFYNVEYRYDYISGPWYRYILLILGVLIPPTSISLSYGFLRTLKKYAILFWPVMIFLIFHSLYPNKQERFILPILPMLLLLGTVGWQQFVTNSGFWGSKIKTLKVSHIWFWTLNTILMVTLLFTFSKKTMIEPLVYLSKQEDVNAAIVEYNRAGMPWFPLYYLGRKIPMYRISKDYDANEVLSVMKTRNDFPPEYVFFFGQEDLQERVFNMEKLLAVDLRQEQRFDPSLIDWLLHKMNPKHNLNLTSYIYRVIPDGND